MVRSIGYSGVLLVVRSEVGTMTECLMCGEEYESEQESDLCVACTSYTIGYIHPNEEVTCT